MLAWNQNNNTVNLDQLQIIHRDLLMLVMQATKLVNIITKPPSLLVKYALLVAVVDRHQNLSSQEQ